MIRYGICTSPANARLLAELGYDYIECGVAAMAALDESEFAAAKAAILDSPLRCEAGNSLIPGTYQLTGDETNPDAAAEFLKRALERFVEVGGQVVVFGSSGARNVPEGFARANAMEQLAAFCRTAGDIAADFGVRIAIEPLCRKESNIINSVSEGLELARLAGHPSVGVLADWYHMATENEGTAGILAAKEMLWHCHIAKPEGRLYPLSADDEGADYGAFFGALRAIGYDGRVSVEGSGDPERDGAAALKVMKGY